MTRWVNSYIGIPFTEDGLTRAGCHCWGLVRLVLSEQRGIDLPAYGENSAADLLAAARHFRDDSRKGPWRTVERPQAFDVALMGAMDKGVRISGHCGVMIDRSRLLHVEAATSAVQIPVNHPLIRHRILGFYRHEALA